MPKRLFDKPSVDALFETDWTFLNAEERTTPRYGGEKVLWELIARKP